MTFYERIVNVLSVLFFYILMTSVANPCEDIRLDFDIVHTTQYYEDADLFLVNTNFALDFPRPVLPNTVPVGGLTTKPRNSLDKVSISEKCP